MRRRLIVAIPSTIHVVRQGEVLDPGTILLKFQAGHFVGFRRFFPHRQYGGGARRGPCGGTWAFAKQGFQAATVWQFGLWDIKIAFWRDELPPDWEAPPWISRMASIFLFSLGRMPEE